MLRSFCKSKIHRLKVTDANIDYEGSIALDKKLLKAAGILPGEKVHVLDIDNGKRIETYAIESVKSGEVCMNGAAARVVAPGDIIIVLTYALLSDEEIPAYRMKVVSVDGNNQIVKVKE